MQPGEKRTIEGLLPIFHIAGVTELTARDYETVELPEGERKLLKIDSVMRIGGQKMESVLWTDEEGETHKTFIPGIGQEGVRATREQALSGKRSGPLDLIVASIVPLRGQLPDPARTKRVVYRASVNQGGLSDVFDDCLSQRVTLADDQTATLEVVAVRPGSPADPGEQEKPTGDDTAPNNLVQSDNARVVALAKATAPSEDDPWQLALALERFVHEGVRKKNFSQSPRLSPRLPKWQSGGRGTARSTRCCWRPFAGRGSCRRAWRLGWCTIRRRAVSPITCGTRFGLVIAGCRWTPRLAAAALGPIISSWPTRVCRAAPRTAPCCR
jgi:hypothetical protein